MGAIVPAPVPGESFQECMEVIDELKCDIQEQEQQGAQQVSAVAVSAFFSAVHLVLDLADPVHLVEIEVATENWNRLPKTVTALDNVSVGVDLKSPDLPEKIKVGTQVFVSRERMLDSGKAAGVLAGTSAGRSTRCCTKTTTNGSRLLLTLKSKSTCFQSSSNPIMAFVVSSFPSGTPNCGCKDLEEPRGGKRRRIEEEMEVK
jgi:hypothetical protein